MIINHNLSAMNSQNKLNINAFNQSKSMEKLSSGFRINRASDDAAGLSISEKMRGQIRGLQQGSRNAQDGISLIQTAEGAAGETQEILQRMRELAVQSSNGTNISEDRIQLQKEFKQLKEEVNRIGEQTHFNKQNLLKSSKSVKFQVGANSSQTINIVMKDIRASALKINKDTISSQTGSAAAITSIDAAIQTVSSFRADMGAVQNRLETSIRSTDNTAENLQAAESRIRDVDMAKEMTKFSKENILTQASQAMLAQANQQPQQILQLLR
ncbi:flagellin [Clostridium chrysemydis]|uniref:flagellin N-terminal helical domain-containing protein n=1 Tax=Clostridium chrysemydis TaxID=2665504 RepID=UPI00188349DC|nr:flagellin [Clostridium chrysemydis]